MISFIYFKGLPKYILFGLSSVIHLSMMPIIALYILYHMLKRVRIKSPFIVPLFILVLISFSIVIASNILNFNVTPINSSNLFNVLILFLALLMIFFKQKVFKNVYGFISIGMIFIYLFGFIIDLSFSEYIECNYFVFIFPY